MSWEQRLRDMVLAGGAGALAAVACVDQSGAGSDSGFNGKVENDAGADGDAVPGVNFCCNANADPCCPSQYCGATVTALCTEKMACEAAGLTWDDGTGGCERHDPGPSDASSDAVTSPDVEPGDALSDAVTSPDVVGAFCCNANPDPCCPSHYCGATVTVQCTEKMACEADGGTWNFAGGCALDAGTRDATSDAP